jgi:hypothetical protein
MQERQTTGYGTGGKMDDINIPLVALALGVFAVTVVVAIVVLETAFRRADAREIVVKTRLQEDKTTELGRLLAMQRAELHEGMNLMREAAAIGPATGTATGAAVGATGAAAVAVSQPARRWISIDTAMRVVAREYHEGEVP